MKSSTTIAEKIGHYKYFNFLKDYFDVLSNAVIDNYGDVYQYVGDEIIISWKLEKGLENSNCINCFFEMKQDLKARKSYFIKKYGIFPEFKAGIHFGEVTTGEIGKVKKDITFTGDILNTTARIQSLCNELSVDLLMSSQLFELLKLDPNIQSRSLGKKQLRGKTEILELYTLSND